MVKGIECANVSLFSMTNSELTDIPQAVCNLKQLSTLRLDRDQLRQLPRSCLQNLQNKNILSAIDNILIELQIGVFRGL